MQYWVHMYSSCTKVLSLLNIVDTSACVSSAGQVAPLSPWLCDAPASATAGNLLCNVLTLVGTTAAAVTAGKGVTLEQVEQTLAVFNEYLVHVS